MSSFPLSFFAKESESDSQMIQKAVTQAVKGSFHELTIPKINPRTGEDFYEIDREIRLPDNLTIFFEDAHLRMANSVISHFFVNENWRTEIGYTNAGEQKNIRLIGIGHTVFDGGVHNGCSEQLHRDHPDIYPNMYENIPVFFYNVRDFEIRNIEFKNTRYWSLCFVYCRHGLLSHLCFQNFAWDFTRKIPQENQDGIDLRIGCNFITIEHITGITGDDTIALTALPEEEYEKTMIHREKDFHIHDISISDVEASTHGCAIIRLLAEQGAKIFNVDIDTVKDTGKAIAGTLLLTGTSDPYFLYSKLREMGDVYHITARNLESRGARALSFFEPCRDFLIENVSVSGKAYSAIRFSQNFRADRVRIQNVSIHPDPDYREVAFQNLSEIDASDASLTIQNVTIESVDYVFAGKEIPIGNLTVGEIRKEFRTDRPFHFPSAYSRYQGSAYGVSYRPENLPKETRFNGLLPVEAELE